MARLLARLSASRFAILCFTWTVVLGAYLPSTLLLRSRALFSVTTKLMSTADLIATRAQPYTCDEDLPKCVT
ncbi:hypothetical protein EDB84DRAFT_1486698 [Lactarius hengduanensis]|nr:hypothetical protein EDB84DRAFT_1486698 [Lactarius hengduanensis]